MPELPTCECVRGLPPYDRLTAIYQAAAELSGDTSLPDALCVAGVPTFERFSYIYAALRGLAGDDSLPSQECIEGESFSDQVSRIYQAAVLYADDDSLLSYACVRGLPMWQQWVEVYRALYVAAGSPDDLTNPACVPSTFDVLSEVFCVLAAGEAPCVTPIFVSGTIASDGVTLTLVFSEEVIGDGTGFLLSTDTDDHTLTYQSGDGTNTLVFTISPAALQGEMANLAYEASEGNVASGSCPLETFNSPVTNNTGNTFEYLRPGGVDGYFRPGGVDTYIRP